MTFGLALRSSAATSTTGQIATTTITSRLVTGSGDVTTLSTDKAAISSELHVQPSVNKQSNNHTVCFDFVGCFNNLPPFDNAQQVLPLSPQAIGTTFLLYTHDRLTEPVIIDHVNERLLVGSNYDPKLSTKFIIHGFTNTIRTKWLYTLKDALLRKVDIACHNP